MVESLTQAQAQATRASSTYTLFDSVRIGPTMGDIDKGWFNTWEQLSRQQYLQWFRGRNAGAEGPWTNVVSERRDFAYEVYRLRAEFHAPIAARAYATAPSDALSMPQVFGGQLAANLRLRCVLLGVDDQLVVPAISVPAGVGQAFGYSDGGAVGLNYAGSNGQPVNVSYVLPEPIQVPTATQFYVEGLIDPVWKQYFAQFSAAPGTLALPGNAPGEFVEVPALYSIRLYMDVRRFVQLRGAYAAP